MGLIDEITWPSIAGILALIDILAIITTIMWVLAIKREPSSAIAWSLLVILIPIFGIVAFVLLGYQSIHRPLKRKRDHARDYRSKQIPIMRQELTDADNISTLAEQLGSGPKTTGNALDFYHEGEAAYQAMLQAIDQAKHHIHMEFFILRGDESGYRFIAALAERAKAGVQVRLLYDAIGSWSLRYRHTKPIVDAGGTVVPFMALQNPLRRRLKINLRNHRKILVIDGRIAFTGGFNIGDEYLGKVPKFGGWRDSFVKLQGPAVASLQRVFAEDWDFAHNEEIDGAPFFPPLKPVGKETVQIVWSGPDQDTKAIREVYFAAIMRAKSRIWITTPYFVPDTALTDALAVAARMGRDVRVLLPFRPDKWTPLLASRYLWHDLLTAGVKIYQYTNGFLHAKAMVIDDDWASLGTVNFDNRSFHLNFEVTALITSAHSVEQLAATFLADQEHAIQMNLLTFDARPFISKIAENAARLASPIL